MLSKGKTAIEGLSGNATGAWEIVEFSVVDAPSDHPYWAVDILDFSLA